MKEIAVCTDFSENAAKAFETALEMSRKFEANLHIIHVMPPVVNPVFSDFDMVTYAQPDKSLILKVEERMEAEYGVKIKEGLPYKIAVLDGHVSTEIINYLKEKQIDLVITGSYGLTGMGLVVFGSVAKRISHKAPCSVMIVRDKNEASGQ